MKNTNANLQIKIPDNLLAERNYILNVILSELLGLSYSIMPDKNIKDYQFYLPNKNHFIIKDQFFSHFTKPDSYLKKENIPENIKLSKNQFSPDKNIVILYGNDHINVKKTDSYIQLTCHIDIFASAFFMLTRWEEYVIKERDEHNRFMAKFSLAYKNNFIHRPIVNEYIEFLWNILLFLGYQGKRKNRKFSFEPTHDVDSILYIRNFIDMTRRFTGDFIKRKDSMLALHTLSTYMNRKLRLHKDPYDTFDFIMDLSEKKNYQSRFYFMSGKTSIYDPDFFLYKRFTIQLIKKINQQGHIIGFHPSYKTYNDKKLWQEEYQRISSVSPQPVKSGRQHYLRFAIPDTWQIWDDNNMNFDSSLSYSDRAGFRCGICSEYSVYNILTRKKLNVKEKPLIAMDATLVQYHKISPDEIKEQIMNLIKIVKKYKGTFVLLWHNSSFNLPPWDEYKDVYEEIILNH